MLMIFISIALFTVAATLGIIILIRWLKRKEASAGVVYSHGGIAIAALVFLIAYSIMHPHHFPMFSLILFPFGVIAGLYMFFTKKEGKKEGNKKLISVAFIHAFFVLSGFIALLIFAFMSEKL